MASLHAPTPVLRCRSAICMILNRPLSGILGRGFLTSWGAPRRTVRCAVCGGESRSSGVPVMAQPSRGSAASSPKRTSMSVTAWSESLDFFLLERLSHTPDGRDSHPPVPGFSRPTDTSMTTLSSSPRSSSFFRLTKTYARLVQERLPRYRSFSMRCHTVGSRSQDEKRLSGEHEATVTSVTTRPG